MLIAPIQKLRGVAALFVVVDHALLYAQRFDPSFERYEHLAHILGQTGVGVFFVISGFIMYHTSYNLFGSAEGMRKFWIRRIVRIVPMYYIATLLALGFKLAPTSADKVAAPFHVTELLASLAFFPFSSTDPATLGKMYPLLAQGWTLNYEMFFYLIFGAVLLLDARKGLWAVTLAFAGLALAGVGLAGLGLGGQDPGLLSAAVAFWTHPIILLFLLGVWLGWLKRRLGERTWALPLDPAVIVSLMLLGLILVLDAARVAPLAEDAALATAFVLAVGFCVLATGPLETQGFEPLAASGDASYSIYLFHNFAIGVVGQIWIRVLGQEAPWAFILVCVVSATVGGYVAYRLIERPMVKIGHKVLEPRRGAGPAAVTEPAKS